LAIAMNILTAPAGGRREGGDEVEKVIGARGCAAFVGGGILRRTHFSPCGQCEREKDKGEAAGHGDKRE